MFQINHKPYNRSPLGSPFRILNYEDHSDLHMYGHYHEHYDNRCPYCYLGHAHSKILHFHSVISRAWEQTEFKNRKIMEKYDIITTLNYGKYHVFHYSIPNIIEIVPDIAMNRILDKRKHETHTGFHARTCCKAFRSDSFSKWTAINNLNDIDMFFNQYVLLPYENISLNGKTIK